MEHQNDAPTIRLKCMNCRSLDLRYSAARLVMGDGKVAEANNGESNFLLSMNDRFKCKTGEVMVDLCMVCDDCHHATRIGAVVWSDNGRAEIYISTYEPDRDGSEEYPATDG